VDELLVSVVLWKIRSCQSPPILPLALFLFIWNSCASVRSRMSVCKLRFALHVWTLRNQIYESMIEDREWTWVARSLVAVSQVSFYQLFRANVVEMGWEFWRASAFLVSPRLDTCLNVWTSTFVIRVRCSQNSDIVLLESVINNETINLCVLLSAADVRLRRLSVIFLFAKRCLDNKQLLITNK
jgi:hypothetical protein